MSDRSKYSLNGVYKCENFAQYIENANFPFVPIGSALDLDGWYIYFKVITKNGVTWVFPFIHHHMHPNIRIRVCYKIIKKDGSYAFECQTSNLYLNSDLGCFGRHMNVEKLLDEKNGYLDEGALTVEYGLQVNSEQGEGGIWMFNFHDEFFEWQTKDYMFEFTFEYWDSIFSHKQIIKLHSTTIDANKNSVQVPNFISFAAFLMCLQITHGVRLRMSANYVYRDVITAAFHFGFFNTVKDCERKLIESDEDEKLEAFDFEFAVEHGLRCYLIHLLKQVKTKKHLVKFMRKLDLEKISSESMKAIVAKIFSF